MLLGISLGALLVCLCMLCNRRIERLAAPFVCGLMLLEYALAAWGRLEWLTWIAPACALCALAVLLVRLVKGRGKMLKAGVGCVLTPGLLCLAALAVLFHAGSQGLFVNAADDIHYWAIEVRSLYAHGGLVDARHHLSPNFMNYTPGMALYQWTAMAVLGEWNEPALFAMLWLFYAVMLLPHFEWVTWKRAGWVVLEGLLVIAIPAALGSDAFTMLRVDSALGLCLGYALTQAWYACREQAGRGERLCCFALALCALVLIKLSGVAWALVALGLMLAVRSLSPHPLRLRAALFAAAAPAAVLVSWLAFCAANGLTGMHAESLAEQLEALRGGQSGAGAILTRMPQAIGRALVYVPQEAGFKQLGVLGSIVLTLMAPLALGKKNGLRLFLWALACHALFLAGYALSVVSLLYGESGALLENADFGYSVLMRYHCPLVIGLFVLWLVVLWENRKPAGWSGRLSLPAAAGMALTAVVLLGAPWRVVEQTFFVRSNEVTQFEDRTATYLAENFWTDMLEEPENCVVAYGAASLVSRVEFLQYALAPVKLVMPQEGELDTQTFEDWLRTVGATHVVCMDEDNPVYEGALASMPDGWLDIAMPYAVRWEEGTLILE